MRTDAYIAENHIALFGNTKRITQGEKTVPTIQEKMERLNKIERMLYWNQNKIDTCNEQLTTLGMFCNAIAIRKRLAFNHHVRVRLIGMWNEQLNRMKL
jgi:hypothetical protein